MTEINTRIYQTMTFEEQSEILEYLYKARQIILDKPEINMQADRIQTELTEIFHLVQIANTQPL